MKRIKRFFLTIEHPISLLRQHEDSHGQQLNQRSFSLTMQFAYSLCIALYTLLFAAQQCNFQKFFIMNWHHCSALKLKEIFNKCHLNDL